MSNSSLVYNIDTVQCFYTDHHTQFVNTILGKITLTDHPKHKDKLNTITNKQRQ